MSKPFILGENEAVVICPDHGQVVLPKSDYMYQLSRPDSFWKCPLCGTTSAWDDDNYDAWVEKTEGIWEECEMCKGSGVVTCKRCNGTGWARSDHQDIIFIAFQVSTLLLGRF